MFTSGQIRKISRIAHQQGLSETGFQRRFQHLLESGIFADVIDPMASLESRTAVRRELMLGSLRDKEYVLPVDRRTGFNSRLLETFPEGYRVSLPVWLGPLDGTGKSGAELVENRSRQRREIDFRQVEVVDCWRADHESPLVSEMYRRVKDKGRTSLDAQVAEELYREKDQRTLTWLRKSRKITEIFFFGTVLRQDLTFGNSVPQAVHLQYKEDALMGHWCFQVIDFSVQYPGRYAVVLPSQ